jgi:hypothetical protein
MDFALPLWPDGQSEWPQIQRTGIHFSPLPDFLRSSGSGKGAPSLVRTTEQLLEWKSGVSGLENRD